MTHQKGRARIGSELRTPMQSAPEPENEAARLASLRSFDVLDTPPETGFDDLTLIASTIFGSPIALVSLVDRARQRQALKRGGKNKREDFGAEEHSKGPDPDEVVAVNDLLDTLAEKNSLAAEIVKMHYFSGFTISETAQILQINGTAAHRAWVTAKAWLHREMKKD